MLRHGADDYLFDVLIPEEVDSKRSLRITRAASRGSMSGREMKVKLFDMIPVLDSKLQKTGQKTGRR